MMQFKEKIKVFRITSEGRVKKTMWAKHFKVGDMMYDEHALLWKVMEDVHFEKYWFIEDVI